MDYRIVNTIIFASGAALGSLVTWAAVRNKYKKIADEEIASVKAVYRPVSITENDIQQAEKVTEAIESVIQYPKRDKTEKKEPTDYTKYFRHSVTSIPFEKTEEKEKEMDYDKPYIIEPEEFGQLDDYACIGLNWYADGVLADDGDDIVDDIDDVVGIESINTFNEFNADSIYVRNDARKVDYEIVRDLRTYKEVTGFNSDGVEQEE